MRRAGRTFTMIALAVCGAFPLFSQTPKDDKPVAEAPKLIVLSYQDIEPKKADERDRLAVSMARTCDRLNTPNFWIDLQPLSGPKKVSSLDLFESFDQLEQARTGWNAALNAHPELARSQEQIQGTVSSEKKIFAIRRDDLGYLTDAADLSKSRYVRIDEIRLLPGHENDFAEAIRILKDGFTNLNAEAPWLVYQVSAGAPMPTFLVLMPMSVLKENDDLLAWEAKLPESTNDGDIDRLIQVAREGYFSTESHLYAISPEMSHVSKEFASGDTGFWKRSSSANPGGADSKSGTR